MPERFIGALMALLRAGRIKHTRLDNNLDIDKLAGRVFSLDQHPHEEEEQEQQQEEEGHKRPRGRAPKGKVWNAQSGVWEAKHKPVRKPCSPGWHRMKRKWLTRGVGCLQAAMVLDTEGDKENAGQQRPRRGGRKRKGQGGAGMSNASTASSFSDVHSSQYE